MDNVGAGQGRCLDAQTARFCHHVQSLPPLCRGNELPDVLLQGVSDGIQLVGLRTAESLTRFKCIANTKMERITRGGKFYPIYDWKDSDVWLYIKERNLEFLRST